MSFTIITQARIGSSRLPGKVLKKINGQTLLQIHLQRLKKVIGFEKIIVATTLEPESDYIVSVAKNEGCLIYQGSTEDVLDRFFHASQLVQSTHIVRVTSDCPLIDPVLICQVVQFALNNDFSYCFTSSNFPDGVDVEIFKKKDLEKAYFNARLSSEKEHVTPYIRNQSKSNGTFGEFKCNEGDFRNVRFTVDEQLDFEAIELLINKLGLNCCWLDYSDFILANPTLFFNQQIIRNAGFLKSIKNDRKA